MNTLISNVKSKLKIDMILQISTMDRMRLILITANLTHIVSSTEKL